MKKIQEFEEVNWFDNILTADEVVIAFRMISVDTN